MVVISIEEIYNNISEKGNFYGNHLYTVLEPCAVLH